MLFFVRFILNKADFNIIDIALERKNYLNRLNLRAKGADFHAVRRNRDSHCVRLCE